MSVHEKEITEKKGIEERVEEKLKFENTPMIVTSQKNSWRYNEAKMARATASVIAKDMAYAWMHLKADAGVGSNDLKRQRFSLNGSCKQSMCM